MRTGAVLSIFLVYSALRFLFPSDIPFINDEALLIQRALQDGINGTFSVAGLLGSRGVDYGPFALWFYRMALLVTTDLVWVAVFKMIFIYVVTLGSVVWIAKSTKLSLGLLVGLALTSPYLWFYSRDLWDNSFVIPLSAGFFAAYFDFIATKRTFSLFLSCLFLCLGFLTHLVFVTIVFAFAVHFLLFEFTYIRKNFGKVLCLAAFSTAIVLPYLLHLVHQHPTQKFQTGDLGHLLMPFTGPRFFTSLGLEYFLGETWTKPFASNVMNGVWFLLTGVSALAYPLFIYGFYIMLKDEKRRSIFRVVILVFLFQMFLSFTYRLIPIPNFHSAQWVVYLLGIAVGLEALARKHWVVYPYTVSLGVAVPAFLILVHLNDGSRFIHYGPTLGNQLSVARDLEKVETKTLAREAFHAREFPFALETLRKLELSTAPKVEAKTVLIRYAEPENSKNGRIKVEVFD